MGASLPETAGSDLDEPKPTLPDIRRAARLDLIRQMLPMHRTQVEMAKACGVSERTIRNDITYLRREMAEEVATLTAEKVAADARARFRHLTKLAFDELIPRKTKSGTVVHLPTKEKIALLNTIRQIQQAEVKLLQSLGVIYRAPQQVQILTLAMDRLNALSPQIQSEIAEASSDPAVFERLLIQHIGVEFAGAMLGKPVAAIGASAVAESDATRLADVEEAEAVEAVEAGEAVDGPSSVTDATEATDADHPHPEA